tara:strand:- start:321 stop:860 length:540 start_codon:yes stop_codon:yes gene_type:complete
MTQYARPDAHHSNGVGNWSDGMMGTSNLHLLIDEASADDNTTYIESGAEMDTSPDTAEFTLGDVDDPESAADHKLVYKALGSGGFGPAPNMTVALYQGSTAIASATNTSLSGTYATTTITLSSSEANAISDYTALSVRITRGNANMGDSVAVTQVYFECPDAEEEEEVTTSPAFLLFMG